MGFFDFFEIGDIFSEVSDIFSVLVDATIELLSAVGEAFLNFAKQLGLIEEDMDDIEEIGDMAIQAEEDGIKWEDFDTPSEFFNDVKNNSNYSPDRSLEISTEDKIKKGIEITSTLISEKFPNIPIKDLTECTKNNPEFFSDARIAAITDQLKTNANAVTEVIGYLNGTEKNFEVIENTKNMLVDIEQRLDPTTSEAEAIDKILSMRG